jgi:protein gp37
MAETKIEWTSRRHPLTGEKLPGYTYNKWIGCTKVSPACKLCYAESVDERRFSKTLGGTPEAPQIHWGPGAPRHQTKTFREPLKWNREAARAGIALAVFCSSLSDWADEEVPDSWRDDLFALVLQCPNLDWLFLTKRTAKARAYFADKAVPANVMMGATMETQKCFDERIGDLLAIDAPRGHFASMEPLLGPVDISAGLADPLAHVGGTFTAGPNGATWKPDECGCHAGGRALRWVIVGGESNLADKSKSRPMHPDHVLAVATQCWAAQVPFFFKQWGDWCPAYELDQNPQAQAMCAMGKVPRHEFPTGEAGRRFSFNVGKAIAGRHFEGKLWDQTPPVRVVPMADPLPLKPGRAHPGKYQAAETLPGSY